MSRDHKAGNSRLMSPVQVSGRAVKAGGGPKSIYFLQEISLCLLDDNPYQTRTSLDDGMEELCDSILAQGLIEPIVVRPGEDGRFQVIAGERRVRASHMLGRATIPAVVRDVSDQQAMEMTIVENLQRADLNPMEQAEAFRRLSDEFGLTQAQISSRTGIERSRVANYLRLLKLPKDVQERLRRGELSLAQAKSLLSVPEQLPERVSDMARRAVGQTARETEQQVAECLGKREASDRRAERRELERDLREELTEERGEVDPAVRDTEMDIEQALGVRVLIHDHNGCGFVIFQYNEPADLETLYERVTGNKMQ